MLRTLDRVLNGLLIASLTVLTGSVLLQVLARFVFKVPLPWTEEVSRLSFVYLIFIGAAIGLRERAHLNVDFVIHYLPAKVRHVLGIITQGLVAVFLGFVIYLGIEYALTAGVQTTPVMTIPFRYIYAVIPVTGVLMLLYLVANVADDLRKGAEK